MINRRPKRRACFHDRGEKPRIPKIAAPHRVLQAAVSLPANATSRSPADPVRHAHHPPHSPQRRAGLRHRDGRQLDDARTGVLGGHTAHGGLRQRVRHRGRRLLPGVRRR